MKIACIAPAYPYRGGIAHFGVRLARELALRNSCEYLNFTLLYPSLLFPGKTQFDESAAPVDFASERVINSVNPLTWLKAGRQLKARRVAVALVHWWHPFFGPAYRGMGMAAGRRIRRLAICHNVMPHDTTPAQRRLIRFGLGGMDGFVAHGSSEERELGELFPSTPTLRLFHPIYDIFPGQDMPKAEARFRLGIPVEQRVILYFGLIRPYKGVDVLLEAMTQLTDIPDLRCLIVGEVYAGCESIREEAARLPSERVTLVDRYVPNEEVSDWFRAADLVVLPYKSATQSGIIPIAYRCNRPVVATDVGALPDVVWEGRTGWLVAPDDPVSVADAVRRFFVDLEQPDLSVGIAEICRELSWDSYARQLENFLKSLGVPDEG